MSIDKFKPKTMGEFSAKLLEEAKARRPVPKKKRELREFDCQVDRHLFDKANAVRSTTWVELVDQMLRLAAIGIDFRDLARVYLETLEELEAAYKATKRWPELQKQITERRELAAKIERALI